MNYSEAESAVKKASNIGFVIIAFTVVRFLILFVKGDTESINFLKDPFNYIDFLIIFFCSIMLRRYSRSAAITLLFFFIITKILQFVTTPPISSILVVLLSLIIIIIIVIFFINGVRGTFAYHRLKKNENPEYKPAPKWSYYLGLPLGIVFIGILSLGVLSQIGVLDSTQVVAGKDFSDQDKSLLLKERIIKPNEEVKWFYSSGFSTVLTGGSIVTDKRVVSYELRDNKLDVYSANFDDIKQVIIVQQGSDYNLSDTIAEIVTDKISFYIILSPEENGDKRFISEIENYIYRQKPKSGPSLEELSKRIKH